ncbi:MAG TPA: hypothetical protein DCS93_10630 [Microscillaceae bacterium]|nr:hypothetical protein [Microscillaceae bacterium]
MIKQGEIQALFHRHLKHNIKHIETNRKLIIRYQISQVVGYLLVLVVLCSWNFLLAIDSWAFLSSLMIAMGVIFVSSAAYQAQKQKYHKQYKFHIVRPIAECIDPSWQYQPFKGIDAKEIKASRLFATGYNYYHSDDLISGLIGKTDFQCADVHIQRAVNTNRAYSIFQGLFFHADFHKHFQGAIFVTPDFTKGRWGNAGTFIQKHLVGQGQLVKMENLEFERLFMVHATNPTEARYVLTPVIMEAMVKLRQFYNNPISFAFMGTRMYCAIDFEEPLFEPEIYRSAVNYRDIQFMYALLKINKIIVEEMQLNTRIWTKA